MSDQPIQIRHLRVEDGAAVKTLFAETGALDVNSLYAYVALCDHFGDTSAIAFQGDRAVGAITGYRLPKDPSCYFVWQVGVDSAARGQGVASKILDFLLRSPAVRDLTYLHTTVSPSNEASIRMFRSLAQRHQVELTSRPGYPASLFVGEQHEDEDLYILGPFSQQARSDL